MPGIPREIFSDWIQPGILVGVIALFLGAFRGLRADLKSEIQASEARQEKQMDELQKANEVLAGKVDPLPDAFPAAQA